MGRHKVEPSDFEVVSIPRPAIEVAKRRTKHLLTARGNFHAWNLEEMLATAYLQGVGDYEFIVRQKPAVTLYPLDLFGVEI